MELINVGEKMLLCGPDCSWVKIVNGHDCVASKTCSTVGNVCFHQFLEFFSDLLLLRNRVHISGHANQ